MQRCLLPSCKTHTYLCHQSRDSVCVNPHRRCLEGHTKHHFLLWIAAIILSVLSTAKCLIYKPVFMATVHTHTENLRTILPISPHYINLQHSWHSIQQRVVTQLPSKFASQRMNTLFGLSLKACINVYFIMRWHFTQLPE